MDLEIAFTGGLPLVAAAGYIPTSACSISTVCDTPTHSWLGAAITTIAVLIGRKLSTWINYAHTRAILREVSIAAPCIAERVAEAHR